MRPKPDPEKPIHWGASSKRDLLSCPGKVIDDIGYALGGVQLGGTPPSGKRTASTDIELIHERLKLALIDYEERYGKES